MKNDTFQNDIIICTRDGQYKQLRNDLIADLPNLDERLIPEVNILLERGAVVAAIPSVHGIGASCYLLNLNAIARPETVKKIEGK